MFRLGYNTNGLAHHRLADALELLADLGYEGVALTPDVPHLDPFEATPRAIESVRRRAEDLGLTLAIETGARFLLDPRRKHFPTLLERAAGDRARRVRFLDRCVDLAAELGADVVSVWSGAASGGAVADWPAQSRKPSEELWTRLCEGLREVLESGRERGVRIAFEPEPGMFVATLEGYAELCERLGPDGEELGLCLDVGHLLVTGERDVGDAIRRVAARLVHVHLDDAEQGLHEHRMFGEGELELASTLSALLEVGYRGMAAVELSRDSHRGAEAARSALEHLHRALGAPGG